MSRQWTAPQLEAIQAGEGRYLLSAGAGSGKTAVLTERIKRLILTHEHDEKPLGLANLLVLTFTNKAAHEMKERVRDAFLKEQRSDLASEVETADITTFDAFALSLVKKYHLSLGLSGDLTILDEKDFALAEQQILDEILATYYAKKDPAFLDFVSHYALKDDSLICQMVRLLLSKAELTGDKKAFFDQAVEEAYSPEFLSAQRDEFAEYLHERLLALSESVGGYEDQENLASVDRAFLEPLLSLKTYQELYAGLANLRYPSLSKTDKDTRSAQDTALHGALSKEFGSIRDTLVNFGDEASELAFIEATKPYAEIWLALAKELDERLSAYKACYGVYSFADIAFAAREAVGIPSVCSELKARYRYVMVDEFQDTSDLQFALLSALDNGNFFAVGDIKQSIYRFRKANPALFLSCQERFLKGEGKVIVLPDNFRSRKEVIDDLNALFQELMSKPLGEVTYDQSQALKASNPVYAGSGDDRYHLEKIVYEKAPQWSPSECEARLIAKDIQAKILSGFSVLDKNGIPHTLHYGDCAILISRKANFATYESVFNAAKIPLSVSNDEDLSSADVVMVMQSFLRLGLSIDRDPMACKHCYASIMRSYLYGAKDPEIYRSLADGSYETSPLFETIRGDKGILSHASAEAAVRYYLTKFPLIDRLSVLGDVKANYEALLSFVSQGLAYDRLGGDYASFIDYFSLRSRYDIDFSLPAPQDSGDFVKLMTIHASKGLEFPVVYLSEIDAAVSKQDTSKTLGYSFAHGFLIPQSHVAGNSFNFLFELDKQEEKMAGLSERMRLYYVALTRAKEKAILLERKHPGLTLCREDATHLLQLHEKRGKDGETTFTARIKEPTSFYEFNALSEHFTFQTRQEIPLEVAPLSLTSASEEAIPSPVKRTLTGVERQPLVHLRASKESLEPLDEGALSRGNVLHRYLEVADIKSKDVSFIANPEDRAIILRVMELPLFQEANAAEIYHEYPFYDEENDVHGAIDLLLVYPSKAVVVDFKTKEIDDPAYPKQLALYRAYIERAFNKKCETYLLSILGGFVKEVQ